MSACVDPPCVCLASLDQVKTARHVEEDAAGENVAIQLPLPEQEEADDDLFTASSFHAPDALLFSRGGAADDRDSALDHPRQEAALVES